MRGLKDRASMASGCLTMSLVASTPYIRTILLLLVYGESRIRLLLQGEQTRLR